LAQHLTGGQPRTTLSHHKRWRCIIIIIIISDIVVVVIIIIVVVVVGVIRGQHECGESLSAEHFDVDERRQQKSGRCDAFGAHLSELAAVRRAPRRPAGIGRKRDRFAVALSVVDWLVG
jgi:hypothetical protein